MVAESEHSMNIALSIDPSGEWSPVQARHVLEVIGPEAKTRGLFFQSVDITTFSDPRARVVLVAVCITHGCAVPSGWICPGCVSHERASTR